MYAFILLVKTKTSSSVSMDAYEDKAVAEYRAAYLRNALEAEVNIVEVEVHEKETH